MTKRSAPGLTQLAYSAHAVDAGGEGGAPKTRIQLFPMGVVRGRDGRGPYRLDDLAHAGAVVAASLAGAGASQIPIDYDHQIPFAARDGVGGQAPASGWITGMDADVQGIWATVEWTEAAAQRIRAREYRYISPYFSFEAASGRITQIWNAGLVNLPNFTELAAVAGAELQDPPMDLSHLAKTLGLPADATLEQITAAATAATAAASVDPKAYVPMAVFTELQGQVVALRESGVDAAATAAVDTAVKAGKITPATRDYALKLYKADPEAFAAFVAGSPTLLTAEVVDTSAARANLDAPLTPEERAAAAAIGVAEDAYLKSKKQMAGKL